jgi:hypothetical protein
LQAIEGIFNEVESQSPEKYNIRWNSELQQYLSPRSPHARRKIPGVEGVQQITFALILVTTISLISDFGLMELAKRSVARILVLRKLISETFLHGKSCCPLSQSSSVLLPFE